MSTDNNEPVKKNRIVHHIIKLLTKTRSKSDNPCSFHTFEELDIRRKDMITGIIDLPNKIARDIMIPRVDIIAVESSIDLKPLVKQVCDSGHSRVPIYEETIDNIIGILYAKDLLKLIVDKSKKKFQLKKFLHEPFFVPETMPLDELLLAFKARSHHLAVVVDEYGGIGGIITLEDILEEIVGDITDEYDDDEIPELEQIGRNTYDIDTRMTISDFNRKLKTDIDEDNFDTIGGLVYDLFGRIPDKGESIKHQNITIVIKEKRGTKIDRIIVTLSKK